MESSTRSSSRSSNAPPRLQRQEERIPILKLEKLQDKDVSHLANLTAKKKIKKMCTTGKNKKKTCSSNPDDDNKDYLDTSVASPDIVASPPPQLHSFLDDNSSHSSKNSEEDEASEDSKSTTSVSTTRSTRRFLGKQAKSTSESMEDDSNSKPNSLSLIGTRNKRPHLNHLNNLSKIDKPIEPRKIIQSLFAKPKPHKMKRRKAKAAGSKNKKTKKVQQISKGSIGILKIKIPPANKSNLGNKSLLKKGDRSESKSDDDDNEPIESATEADQTSNNDDSISIKIDDDASGEDDEEMDVPPKAKKTKDNLEDGVNYEKLDIKLEPEEDDSSSSDENSYKGWKPVRAAMVAAMELVAKKQVTDDMRTERRVRKYNLKPLPPKGRGRRTIFKKAAKPVRASQGSQFPHVVDSVFHNGCYYQKGDIFCAVQDFEERNKELPIRYYQARGFLQSDAFGLSVGVVYLRRNCLCDIDFENPDIRPPFSPNFYRPDYEPGELLLKLDDMQWIMHCPLDFYHGHDILYNKADPGSVFMRLGTKICNTQDPINQFTPSKLKEEIEENVIIKDETDSIFENVSIKDDNVSIKDDNVSIKDDNVSIKDDNVSIKDDNVSIKDDNVSIKDDNVSIKDDNVSIKDDNVGIKDETDSVKEEIVSDAGS